MDSPRIEIEQFERIRTKAFRTSDEAVREVAASISKLIGKRQSEGKNVVLGLATGSTPVKLYKELIRLHREEGLSFANVISFNLDEYYGLPPDHPESYHRFMAVQLFQHVNILPENVHVPDGLVDRSKVFEFCLDYERKIREIGGIDIQILGIGRTGHIGFNEPGSGIDSRTRMVALDRITRRDAARDFRGEANVPEHAITMGVGTILEAREIQLLAWGDSKAGILKMAIEGPQVDSVPASYLQRHPNCTCSIDEAAAAELTRFRTPWRVGQVAWVASLIRKAVVWAAGELKKPVLRLRDDDYAENGLTSLLVETGSAYRLNLRIFNELQHTITGWPGGKPNSDDSNRPVPAEPAHKRVLVFGPEPLDAEIGMGGTLNRLVNHGHDLTFVYLTSGNLSVPDNEARMAISLLNEIRLSHSEQTPNLLVPLAEELDRKAAFDEDSAELRQFKGLIRKAEARASCQILALDLSKVLFLDLPFYETGRYRQFLTTETDIERILALFRTIRPHQVYLTGSGADPSSVAGIVHRLVMTAFERCRAEEWTGKCQTWLYALSDRAWLSHEIDMAVPLSPAELTLKLECIYHHRSQRNQTPFIEHGSGETWQQAENANRATAQEYDQLGMAEYEAIEAFRQASFTRT
jgi:glucosamine-6-phosphate deaminase